jgi:hypothetical protein
LFSLFSLFSLLPCCVLILIYFFLFPFSPSLLYYPFFKTSILLSIILFLVFSHSPSSTFSSTLLYLLILFPSSLPHLIRQCPVLNLVCVCDKSRWIIHVSLYYDPPFIITM